MGRDHDGARGVEAHVRAGRAASRAAFAEDLDSGRVGASTSGARLLIVDAASVRPGHPLRCTGFVPEQRAHWLGAGTAIETVPIVRDTPDWMLLGAP